MAGGCFVVVCSFQRPQAHDAAGGNFNRGFFLCSLQVRSPWQFILDYLKLCVYLPSEEMQPCLCSYFLNPTSSSSSSSSSSHSSLFMTSPLPLRRPSLSVVYCPIKEKRRRNNNNRKRRWRRERRRSRRQRFRLCRHRVFVGLYWCGLCLSQHQGGGAAELLKPCLSSRWN